MVTLVHRPGKKNLADQLSRVGEREESAPDLQKLETEEATESILEIKPNVEIDESDSFCTNEGPELEQ